MSQFLTSSPARLVSTPPIPASHPRLRWLDGAICLGLAALSLGILWSLFHAGFIPLDDNVFLTDNWRLAHGLTAESIRWAFSANLLYSTPTSEYFQPLVLLSRLLDVTLFGFDPHGHHATSVVLHLAFLALLYLTLLRLTRSRAAAVFIAVLVAAHPLLVEPAAWVAARKDLLAGLFSVLVVLQFVRHVGKPSRWSYAALLGIYLLAALTKPVVMTLPAVLLLLNYWPLCRWTGAPAERPGVQKQPASFLLLEMVPLFAVALALAVLAWVAQHNLGATAVTEALPLSRRLAGASVNYVSYLALTLWPVNLSIVYPHFSDLSLAKSTAAFTLLAAFTAAVFFWRKKYPSLLVGWLWFVITLSPSSGLFPLGASRMGDRYMYFAMTGLLLAVSPWAAAVFRSARRPAIVVTGLLVLTLSWRAHTQATLWRSGLTIVSRASSLYPDSAALHNLRGTAQEQEGQHAAAARSYLRAAELDPASCFPFINLAGMCLRARHFEEAKQYFIRAATLAPNNVGVLVSLGEVCLQTGELPQARAVLDESLRLRPLNARALHARARTFLRQGHPAEALADAAEAARIEPGNSEYRRSLAECRTLTLR